jgi:hypothetical protein
MRPVVATNRGEASCGSRAKNVPEEEETEVVKAGIMYHTAIHADAVPLREGITFVMGTSNKPAKKAKSDQKLKKRGKSCP